MTVVPISTVLLNLKLIYIHAIGSDAVEAQSRHAIHVGRQDHAVPVNGCIFAQLIPDPQRDRIPFTPTKKRSWNSAVDGHCRPSRAGDVDRRLPNQ